MQKNVGKVDKYIRIGLGLVLIVLAVMGTIGPWGYLGIVPLATGFFNSCPAYSLLGMNTCSAERKSTA